MTCKSGLVTRTLFTTAILVGCVVLYFLSAAPVLKINDRLETGDWINLGEEQFPTWRRFYRPVIWTMRTSPLSRPLTAWSTLWVSPFTLEDALEPAASFRGTISEFTTVISCSFGPDDDDGEGTDVAESAAEVEMPDARTGRSEASPQAESPSRVPVRHFRQGGL